MTRARTAAAVAAIAAIVAGCGLGPGESSSGEATLTVTREYGTVPMIEASESDPAGSETVIRLLDREAEITTRFGGGFVQSIDGVAGGVSGTRASDWFFFVNGIESSVGSAEAEVRGGDRIWWDYRDWSDALRTPAVVGSWPEPFAQGSVPEAERDPVRLECLGEDAPCDRVASALDDEGVAVSEDEESEGPRLLVGAWERVSADPAAAQIERGPAASGVFADFERAGAGFRLVQLDAAAAPVAHAGAGAGLIAAVREGEQPPTWVVTGVDAAGVEGAADAFGPDALANRYAVAVTEAGVTPLPAEVPR